MEEKMNIIEKIYNTVDDRRENPKEGSYVNYLLEKGLDKILKKVGEEASETIIAAKNEDKQELIYETADLIFHLLVLLNHQGIRYDEILTELEGRHK